MDHTDESAGSSAGTAAGDVATEATLRPASDGQVAGRKPVPPPDASGDHGIVIQAVAGLRPGQRSEILRGLLHGHLIAGRSFDFFHLLRAIEEHGYSDHGVVRQWARSFPMALIPGPDHGLSAEQNRERAEAVFELKWPGFPLDYRSALDHLTTANKPPFFYTRVRQFLHEVNQVPEDQKARFDDAATWGDLADLLRRDIAVVLSLRGEIDQAHLVPENLEAFLTEIARLRQAGESVVLVGAHVGTFLYSGTLLRQALPDIVVLMKEVSGGGRGNFISLSQGPERALFQLIKHLRKPGNLAAIGADGNLGELKYDLELFGRNLKFSVGAPFVLFQARCQPIWYMLGWQGSRLRFSYVPGPKAQRGETYDSWLASWFNFYGDRLREVITGDPRNLRYSAGGLWLRF